jgi:hypothetical protein
MTVDHIGQLDAENRETVFDLILCHPFAGHLAREYLDFQAMRGATAESGALELIAWLVLAREACGLEGVGHA